MEALESKWFGDDMKKVSDGVNVTVKSIHNLQMHSAAFTRLLMNERLLDAIEDVMGTPNILLHHTKAHLKPPGRGAPYLMHQDYPYFPFKKHSMLAVFVHFDTATPENGCLCVYPGSHKLGPILERHAVDERGEAVYYVDPERWPISGATALPAAKGDVVIFSYLLMHGSYLNLSDRPRGMFLAQLRAADDEPTEDVHRSACQDMVLRGKHLKCRAEVMPTRYADRAHP